MSTSSGSRPIDDLDEALDLEHAQRRARDSGDLPDTPDAPDLADDAPSTEDALDDPADEPEPERIDAAAAGLAAARAALSRRGVSLDPPPAPEDADPADPALEQAPVEDAGVDLEKYPALNAKAKPRQGQMKKAPPLLRPLDYDPRRDAEALAAAAEEEAKPVKEPMSMIVKLEIGVVILMLFALVYIGVF